MNQSYEYWNKCYESVNSEGFSPGDPSSCLINFIENYLKKGDTILDLGCGGGTNSLYLAQHGYLVYGVDISINAVEHCRKIFSRLNLAGEFKQGRFDNIPFSDGFFNAVICTAALDHVTYSDAVVGLNEIWRVLAPRALIFLTFDPPDTDEDRLDEAEVLADGTLKFIKGDQTGMLFRRYTDEEIINLVGKSRIVSFNHSKNGSRIIICRKIDTQVLSAETEQEST